MPGWSVGWQQAKSLVAAFLMKRRPLQPPMCTSHYMEYRSVIIGILCGVATQNLIGSENQIRHLNLSFNGFEHNDTTEHNRMLYSQLKSRYR